MEPFVFVWPILNLHTRARAVEPGDFRFIDELGNCGGPVGFLGLDSAGDKPGNFISGHFRICARGGCRVGCVGLVGIPLWLYPNL
jgi:hypothetical protein